MVRVLGGRVLRGVGFGPPRQVHQLGLGAQGQEVLPVHVARLIRQVASCFLIQLSLEGKDLVENVKIIWRDCMIGSVFVCITSAPTSVHYSQSKLKLMIRTIRPNNGSNLSTEGIMWQHSHV